MSAKFIQYFKDLRVEFCRESVNILLLFGIIASLIGTMLGSSDTIEHFAFLHRVFAPEVYRIDAGIKELTFFPPNGKHAALNQTETGFTEILEIIRHNDQGVPQKIVQITNRKEYPAIFYWSHKGDQNAILLDLVEQADDQSEVYPVNYTTDVFRWVNQERMKILVSRAFIWIFVGILFDFVGCFFCFRLRRNRTGKKVRSDDSSQSTSNRGCELNPNYWKIPMAILFLLLGYWIIYFNRKSLFYFPAKDSFDDMPRLWGCIAASFIGFAFLAFKSIPSKKTTFPWTYLWYYPVLCIIGATLIFAVCQLFERSNGYLFYFLAFPLSFISANLTDYFWTVILHRLLKE
ncbi:MAG: hypothetical protein A3G33_01420 [Omnitrophica bacterium RIFCSPLOWO2_12_FULL_44_17]|uniref:Uncharacterized protein n=1 Tax=Candidatus Danuiimicrobium aquiferis TaxID=1801832 RepID=A0A1G1L1N3_9BACT|nr:MAG: hypothetical protein A3B72_00650 [Omnitrophica bacterium RIFCSPHIGHO2_02_FULL_45_28]OGW92100.1 MAG: hypothetical protein A3E74_01525 [Omnitrophica bacterium RIFCSPHIGHO2_12_FULL_44_12]OGW99062.1 MAG: hypothetical protein A3G33_01420 [Omnitrophica bacterium RIFCSPLOWO2_12_FULL_44_17]OGX04135.1 MAG: hypothetical protein A3J12_11070 [Omnitrophica bacterium RIFCSPLOWO2_02_FULL_44_11]